MMKADILNMPADRLMSRAAALRDEGFGHAVTYSRKVFMPLTRLCRDVCHYCTYATTPKNLRSPYMSMEQVLKIATDGNKAGCKEALFTLGDKPELRYQAARQALNEMGYETTIDYVEAAARETFKKTGLLPHLNPGILSPADYERLRPVSASMGLMLETGAERLSKKGGPHYGSPDKDPKVRFQAIRDAGEANVPFTTGLLIGIGETREERLEDLWALKDIHQTYGHIQDLIIQPFRAKAGTKMVASPDATDEDLLWTLAAARVIFGPSMSIQAPPNLSKPETFMSLINAGINDWGGVSPVTPDHVNPEAPWPHLEELDRLTQGAGKNLRERLAITPRYAQEPEKWLDKSIAKRVYKLTDSSGFVRNDDWAAGLSKVTPHIDKNGLRDPAIAPLIYDAATEGVHLDEGAIARLFKASGSDVMAIAEAADHVRKERVGDDVTYVVNRNINYTNICLYSCQFCAFSKGRGRDSLRGRPYGLDLENVTSKTIEAVQKGATEVCMQGGIHPDFDGNTYLKILEATRQGSQGVHIHAFSPLEVSHGAKTLNITVEDLLFQMKRAGLGSLPGTAAEILHDDVRKTLCADKVNTQQWLDIMETAHSVGLPSTATIMFGHMEKPSHWARHLAVIRSLQQKTGGFTEFVPLPFVHMQSPIYLSGRARPGPTWSETVLMHAISRLVFKGLIDNIQGSWVKLGMEGTKAMLSYGINDIGGVLMNESITSSAGASHGQKQDAHALTSLIRLAGKTPKQRNTLYKYIADVNAANDDAKKMRISA